MAGLLRDEVLAQLDELDKELEADQSLEEQRRPRNRRRYVVRRALDYGAITLREAQHYYGYA